jgi:hypothetical protein
MFESKDGRQRFNTVKTDGQGRYISEGLQPGVYRVTLAVNGAEGVHYKYEDQSGPNDAVEF